jgi:hypothetical protein
MQANASKKEIARRLSSSASYSRLNDPGDIRPCKAGRRAGGTGGDRSRSCSSASRE